jgi:C4-dicarboxylate-specific signal transduction histidine kinase
LTLILAIFLAHLQLIRKNAERLAEEIASDRDHHRSIAFQAAKMSLVGEMAGGIAHEINNPLSVIAVSAQQIKRTLISRDESDPLLPKLDKISTTVERITKIVQGLRTFSRSGEKLPASTCSLHSLVHGVLDLCRERFYHHNIEILLDPIPTVHLQVVEVQIEQVLMNLLSNSFDAIQGSEKPWVKISFELLADRIHIRVTDSGSGISEAIRDRLMQPFFTTKEVGKGTGLGLSISKGIMESHGGSLLLDRESFHTSFVMILPLVENGRKVS